jgi:hypothetical protein
VWLLIFTSLLALFAVGLCFRPMGGSASVKERATGLFSTDRTCGFASPWETFTPISELDADATYYCVSTWALVPLVSVPAFFTRVARIRSSLIALQPGRAIGASYSGRLVWPGAVVAETLTVWHDRRHSKEFFRSKLHLEAMKTLRHVEARSHKTLVRARDLPPPGTRPIALWTAVKSGDFPAAED